MEGVKMESLPSLNSPCTPSVIGGTKPDGRTGSVSLPMTPDNVSTAGSMKFPQLSEQRRKRAGGYGARVFASGAPDIVQQIFTGQIPPTFFNNMCYGTNQPTAGVFRYKTPTKERCKELWEPKNVSREKARHVIRDIQDASMQWPHLAGTMGTKRTGGYGARLCAYGTPNIAHQIFTGQIPSSFFNDMCYGTNQATAGVFRYKTPTKERTKELWEPKNVSREEARHVIRDIQDARFRKQAILERASTKKEKIRLKKMETARLREAETMCRGLCAYLAKLDKQTAKYANIKVHTKRKVKREVKPFYDSEVDADY